jgi:hypothetical protein
MSAYAASVPGVVIATRRRAGLGLSLLHREF